MTIYSPYFINISRFREVLGIQVCELNCTSFHNKISPKGWILRNYVVQSRALIFIYNSNFLSINV
jgi:hypothetical protein